MYLRYVIHKGIKEEGKRERVRGKGERGAGGERERERERERWPERGWIDPSRPLFHQIPLKLLISLILSYMWSYCHSSIVYPS